MAPYEKAPFRSRFKDYLRSRGLSMTPQRSSILDFLSVESSHFDAEELIDAMRKQNYAVSRATVYRTLAHLQNAGFIRKIEFDTPHAHFEFVAGTDHHEHIICESCGQIFEFADPTLENRIKAIAREFDFSMTRHTAQIFGLCRSCREKQET